jgi:predicted MFS family arabinose efflux permease
MSAPTSREDYPSSNKLLLLALVLSRAITQPPLALTGLLLIDISISFGQPIGVTGQIRTLSSALAIIFALLMSVLSIQYKHRTLLITGLLLYCISALSSSLAPSFFFLLLAYSLTGLGRAMVNPMVSTLVGDLLPLDERSKAIGWLFAGMSISYFISSPIIGIISELGNWRLAFQAFVLPFTILSLVITWIGVPSQTEHQLLKISGESHLNIFKEILSNKSVVACFFGAALTEVSWASALSFSISFFRQRFLLPISWASYLLSSIALCCGIGSVLSGYLINRFGRKTIVVISAFLLGVFSITYVNLQIFWLSVLFMCLNSVLAAIRYSASDSLTLEQVPEHRATVMSVNTAAYSLGSTFGTGLGGLVLILWGYGSLGVYTGIMAIIAAIIFRFLSIDPTQKNIK